MNGTIHGPHDFNRQEENKSYHVPDDLIKYGVSTHRSSLDFSWGNPLPTTGTPGARETVGEESTIFTGLDSVQYYLN